MYVFSDKYKCSMCDRVCITRAQLYRHRIFDHSNPLELQDTPWNSEEDAPWAEDGNAGLKVEYETNMAHICAQSKVGPVQCIYNFPTNNLSGGISEISDAFEKVFHEQNSAFKVQFWIGLILQNSETEEFRYFIPYKNNSLFDHPHTVSKPSDLSKVKHIIQNLDMEHLFMVQRPSTKHVPVMITNFNIVVHKLHYPIGHGLLPDYLKDNSSLIGLDTDNIGNEIKDHLCVFRCIAAHFDPKNKHGRYLQYYTDFAKFLKANTDMKLKKDPQRFSGLDLDLVPYLEECFKIDIVIVQMSPEGLVTNVYNSMSLYGNTMYVNLYEEHFSYIVSFNSFAKKFQCDTCKKIFDQACHYKRHLHTCSGVTKPKYPGGFKKVSPKLFDKMEMFGIHVDEADRINPYFAVYDFESILEPIHEFSGSNTKYFQNHKPVSVSVCSNLEDKSEPQCFVNEDVTELVREMYIYMCGISQSFRCEMMAKFQWVFERIKEILKVMGFDLEKHKEQMAAKERGEELDEAVQKINVEIRHLINLDENLELYCCQLPVFGFNSSNYDLNLILAPMIKVFKLHENAEMIIKKMNSYSCIATKGFKFLDLSNFLAPGTSYSQFLKAYGVPESKLFFPYEYLDSFERLSETEFPVYETFYSTLKKCNVLEADHLAWEKHQNGAEPKTGLQNYEMMKELWHSKGMTTLKDLLVEYNNADTLPMTKGIEALMRYYHDKGINVSSNFISVPGIAREILFDEARKQNAYFTIFNEYFSHLYELFRRNCYGGPSIVFHRKLIRNETPIRGNWEFLVKKIYGYDANSLYNWSISQDMPTGAFVYRDSDNDFIPEKQERYTLMYAWLHYLEEKNDIKITTKLNMGGEKPVDNYLIDGWERESNTLYEFNGCQ